ncbi:hypothetical protein ADK41_21955 [Streptomyces caelestis]|uniref:Uncharacterized protein n=1 Tax=Streptomyces caelestis TaxID=36816 RepID=A0A0N0S5T5_9ACTN|nr:MULTISPECIES: hypothetical protein [Streptomyces]KOT36622.1 hypothetical protein ADK41_21955 [Streptomyces caelestis]
MTGTAAAASYHSARGSGCKVIDSMDAGEGDTFLTCNSSTGYDCVVTVGGAPGARIDRGGRAESTCTRINHTVHCG